MHNEGCDNGTTWSVVRELKSVSRYPRQTYNEMIMDSVKCSKETKSNSQRTERNQYDVFLHEAQKLKMKELWDDEEDEVWEK